MHTITKTKYLLTIFLFLGISVRTFSQTTVVATNPDTNALDVATTTNIDLTFNQNIDATSLTAATVTISGTNGLPSSFPAVVATTATASINPNLDFFPGEIITTTLTTGVASSTGIPLIAPFTYQFTAAVSPDSPGEFPIGQNTITTLANGARSVTTADLDGDGDLDVLSASQTDNRIAWYKNDGNGNLGVQQTITTAAERAQSVTIGDLDGDGDLDVLSASLFDSRIAWYENDGNGSFGLQQTITTLADGAFDVTTADLDGDGDLDVLSASSNDNRIAWYENDGNGSFGVQQTITTGAGFAFSVSTADLDNDGDLDVLSASFIDDRIAWYENDGNGIFGSQQTITTLADEARSVTSADLDGDGDLDVLSASSADNRIAWYKNNGNGSFGPQLTITTLADGAFDVTTGDLDGDGDLDVLSASLNDDRVAWYENNGNGSFGVQQTISTGIDGATSLTTADLDGDGDLDVLSTSFFDNRVAWYENAIPLQFITSVPDTNALNVGTTTNIDLTFNQNIDATSLTAATVKISGTNGLPSSFPAVVATAATASINPNLDFFPGEIVTTTLTTAVTSSSGAPLISPFTYRFTAAVSPDSPGEFSMGQNTITTLADGALDAAIADLDGDGDLDVLSASLLDNRIAWYENDGNGNFGAQRTITTSANRAASVTTADLDGDGDLDVLSASDFDHRIAWYENDGNGNFGSQQTITTLAIGARSVTSADLDGDGDLDVLSASRADNRIAWYENDGNGNFGPQQTITTSAIFSFSVSTGDLDGDGDLDVLSASVNDNRIAWYENDGNGNFGVQQTITIAVNGAYDVTTADLDGDGDLDVLSASRSDNRIAWYKNDGNGNFGSQLTITTLAIAAFDVNTADLDGDGDIDVLSASSNDDRIAWYENDGNGNFGVQQTITTAADDATSVSTGDLDGDGDLDVLSSSFIDDRIAWYENALPLQLITSVPNINALHVDTATDINLTFNNNINAATLTAATVKISGNNGLPSSFPAVMATGATASINPNLNFFPGEVITTTLTTGVASGTGSPLISPFTYRFTVAVNPNSPGEFSLGNTIIDLGNGMNDMITGDLDGDGDLDVLSSSFSDNRIAWYENDGNGNFGPQQTITIAALGAQSLSTADLDGDGDLDVLSASETDDRIAWYENDGNGSFGTQQTITTAALGAFDVVTADLDGDGDLDMLSASNDDDRIAWYENDGNGVFGVQQTISTLANGAGSVTTADLDGDGDLDVLSSSFSDDRIAWYENDGNGNFGPQQTISTLANGASNAITADLDGDGDLDVLSVSLFDNRIAWYKNDGNGNFGVQQTIIITADSNSATSVSTGDLDGDGDLDVLSTSFTDDQVAWYENDGTGGFGPQQTITTLANGAYRVTTADLDGDGDLDVLSTSFNGGRIAWYENVLPPLCPGGTTTYTIAGGWDNGMPDATMIAVIAEDYSTNTMGLGDINACELTVNAMATLTITDGNFVSVQNDITIDGTLTVDHQGSLVQVAEDAITTNNGSITVSKTTPSVAGRNFIALSSPMSAETRDQVYGNARAVFGIIPANFVPFDVDLMEFPEFAGAENFLDDNLDYLDPYTGSRALPAAGIGMLVFPSPEDDTPEATYNLTYDEGTLNSGTITVPINYNGPETINNYNLLGNPYASAIDVNAFITANAAVNQVYYWEHITNPSGDLPGFGSSNFSMNDISIRNALVGISAVNGGTSPGQFMASGQGFAIKADQSQAMSNTPVTFTNSIRVTGNNDDLRSAETTDTDLIWFNLTTNAYEDAVSQTAVGFIPQATPGFDPGYDSVRLGTFISLFTTLETGEQLAIQGREVFDPAIELTVGFSTTVETEETYTISIHNFEGANIANVPVFLIDHLTNSVTNLKEGDYNFTAIRGIQPERFTVVFQEREVLEIDDIRFRESVTLYPNPATDQVTLTYAGEAQLQELTIIDMNGKLIKTVSLENFNNSQNIQTSELAKGMYFIQIQSNRDVITQKLIIK